MPINTLGTKNKTIKKDSRKTEELEKTEKASKPSIKELVAEYKKSSPQKQVIINTEEITNCKNRKNSC